MINHFQKNIQKFQNNLIRHNLRRNNKHHNHKSNLGDNDIRNHRSNQCGGVLASENGKDNHRLDHRLAPTSRAGIQSNALRSC